MTNSAHLSITLLDMTVQQVLVIL